MYLFEPMLIPCVCLIKEIKNPSECIVELYKHVGIFNNTRELHREARGAADCFPNFSSVLKKTHVLKPQQCKSQNEVLISLIKC